jgi:hypothetical protein
MAYKNRSLTSIVDKVFIYFQYLDNNYRLNVYETELDVIIETKGDLKANENLTMIFKFNVPSDFPSPSEISEFQIIEIVFYHSEEGFNYPGCIFVSANDDLFLFGQRLIPNSEAKLVFTLPKLYFGIEV